MLNQRLHFLPFIIRRYTAKLVGLMSVAKAHIVPASPFAFAWNIAIMLSSRECIKNVDSMLLDPQLLQQLSRISDTTYNDDEKGKHICVIVEVLNKC